LIFAQQVLAFIEELSPELVIEATITVKAATPNPDISSFSA
jgi:hypothetical protein